MSTTYVVDTNIINWLVDGRILSSEMPGDGIFVTTHIQIDEINRTSDEERRARLLITLASSLSGVLPTETAVWDVSRFDHAKCGDGVLYNKMKERLDAINGGKSSNIRDALIAEVAVKNGHTLLTADGDLATVTKEFDGSVRLFEVRI